MDKEITQIESIELYLDGKLKGSEKEQFEQQLQEDRAFSDLYEETRSMVQGIRFSARQKLLEKLKATEKELPEVLLHKGRTMKRYLLPLAAAATIAILVGTYLLAGPGRSEKAMNQYLAEHMEPYQNIIYPTQRAEQTETDELKTAYHLYDAGQYMTAIQRFSTLQLEGDEALNAQFYIGNAYMAIGDYSRAIDIFTKLLQEETIFTNQIRWYLSMCYLQEGKEGQALEELETLSNSGSSYAGKAETLLDMVN